MYVIATVKPWNIKNFKKLKKKNFFLIKDYKKLTYKKLKLINPKYIFFPHWSKKVPQKIIKNFYCICFHETKLPYGRGGSPIQNLILRNVKKSKITAFKMTEKFDEGPIIMRRSFDLNGNASEIFENCSIEIFKMIEKIVKSKISLKKQKGKITYFKRLQNNSQITNKDNSINKIYNKIRMLDAETYKKALIKVGKFSYEFNSAIKKGNNIVASVKIKKI